MTPDDPIITVLVADEEEASDEADATEGAAHAEAPDGDEETA